MSDAGNHPAHPAHPAQRVANLAMGACLGVMALAVFVNVVLRYGFGSGVAASEELSRLLFVWMVFIGATAAYPAGEHMAFTSLVALLEGRPAALAVMTVLIRALTVLACGPFSPGSSTNDTTPPTVNRLKASLSTLVFSRSECSAATPLTKWLPTAARCAIRTDFPPSSPITSNRPLARRPSASALAFFTIWAW